MEEPRVPLPEPPALSQRSIVLLRLLLLLLAAGAAVVAVAVAFRHPVDTGARYVCPMHAEVRAKAPGSCPICGMDLEPIGRDRGAAPAGPPGTAALPDMTAFENVRRHKIFGPVRMRSLLPNLQEIRGPAWATSDREISAILYRDQIESLSPEEPGVFSLTASPKTSVAVARIPGPAVAWDQSTSLLRWRLVTVGRGKSSDDPIRAGQVGWVQTALKTRAVLTVPVSAVLQEPEGPYVLTWAGGEKIAKRRIELGEYFATQGFAVVLSGLRPHDQVVSRAAFFLDADRRLGGDDHPLWSTP
jgi:hypothetical protein